MSSSRSGRSSHRGRQGLGPQRAVQRMIESLQTHTVNTLTELVRIERVAATCEDENDAIAFQGPMTEARSYPFSGDLLMDAQMRVRSDPESNRSWNLAWLCLRKIVDDNLVSIYAAIMAAQQDMWGGRDPTPDEAAQLAQCFEFEWNSAVNTMLRHWSIAPTWY